MSDTPRTDMEEKRQSDEYRCMSGLDWPSFPADFDFARQLERELTEARTRIKELADIGGALAGHVEYCECQRWPRSLKDWEETVKRCLEGIE